MLRKEARVHCHASKAPWIYILYGLSHMSQKLPKTKPGQVRKNPKHRDEPEPHQNFSYLHLPEIQDTSIAAYTYSSKELKSYFPFKI